MNSAEEIVHLRACLAEAKQLLVDAHLLMNSSVISKTPVSRVFFGIWVEEYFRLFLSFGKGALS